MKGQMMKQFLSYLQQKYGSGGRRSAGLGTRVTTPQMPVFQKREMGTDMQQLGMGLQQLGAPPAMGGGEQAIQMNQQPEPTVRRDATSTMF